jgi:Lrp/AsnC family transcriptional regulator for asnA, asnC and gidA
MENQIDPIDIRILSELTQDAEIPFVQLAKKLKVSNTLIHQRVKKLKEKGILRKARYEIDSYKVGFQTSAYTQIRLENNKYHSRIEDKLKQIPEIVECVNISGPYALLVKILAKNNRHLRDIIYDKILEIDGVENTNSTFSFETAFRRSLPVDL